MRQVSTILVLIPPTGNYTRQLNRGIREYAISHTDWSLRFGTLPRAEKLHQLDPGPGGGIIGFFTDTEREQAAQSIGVPVVNVSAREQQSAIPRVVPDNYQIGTLAADHLLSLGFHHFAFVGQPHFGYGAERLAGFKDCLENSGMTYDVLGGTPEDHQRWLAQCPRPCGVFADTDAYAYRTAEMCYELGIEVPDQIAVIGVDDDPDICAYARVPLTSVNSGGQRVGHEAAALLDRLIRGGDSPQSPLRVPVGPVEIRQSTDTVAVSDPDLATAIRYIREHACDPLRIQSLVEHVSIGRRTLEKRFKDQFGKTIHEAIRHAQLQQARRLLRMTDLRVIDVAYRSGFSDDRMFGKVFKREIGVTPGQYRKSSG